MGAGAAVNSTLRLAAQSPTGKVDERKAATSPSRTSPKVIVRQQTITNPLQSAYDALRAGRFEEAGVAYRQALKSNPVERDALLGLAHLAHRQGSFDEARDLYQQVLRLDPEQPDAAAGLLSIASTSDPAAAASRMRDLAERSPQSPVTMSTLGSMLAREGRIGEAQQAFFRAYTLDPEKCSARLQPGGGPGSPAQVCAGARVLPTCAPARREGRQFWRHRLPG
jgi:Flp pilus assembly protein TadD